MASLSAQKWLRPVTLGMVNRRRDGSICDGRAWAAPALFLLAGNTKVSETRRQRVCEVLTYDSR